MEKKSLDEVKNEKEDIFKRELDMMLGHDVVLTDAEQEANSIVMDYKIKTLDAAFKNPEGFQLSKHFFEYKDKIKNTELFQLIKTMPKGAVLHCHDTAILGPDYVLELTYSDNLYINFEKGELNFKFAKDAKQLNGSNNWQLLKEVRKNSGDVEKFDANLRKHFTIVTDKPNEDYPDINTVWEKFFSYFIKTSSIFCYKPIWEKYFYDSLKAFREDNVMYVEIRSVLPSLYDLDGNIYNSVATAESYKKVLDQFMRDYPDFYGARLIYAPIRFANAETVTEYLKIAKEIKKRMPNFFAGFDLVGQEDLGKPTKEFLKELVESSDEIDYFFHAGETNWNGSTSDENLIDSIALGTKRIGHAYALPKHPVVLEEVKKKKIALEINVISNAVLKLVEDVRNHPLSYFLARDFPVVISSDDPGVWEAEPLSHDFYVTFVGVSSKHADLKLLKKLALNSLTYSTYPHKDKIKDEFERRWFNFIQKVIRRK